MKIIFHPAWPRFYVQRDEQGFWEIIGEVPNEKQWAIIKEHLELCFKKVTVVPAQTIPQGIIPNTHSIDDWAKQVQQPFDKNNPYPVAIC